MLLTNASKNLIVAAKPSDIGVDGLLQVGEFRIQTGASNRSVLWTWDGGQWVGYGLSPILSAGNPNGFVTSDCVGQLCINTSGNQLYRSNSAGSTTWIAIGGAAGGGGS